ncbi:PAS domain-containing protein [Scytonema sp. UIC 10036]|uniref:PAS domain-containing protein n=1 Tax=Scytonema sp. UIC 10036 TaxID=2304196 RepID=UPI00325BBAE6
MLHFTFWNQGAWEIYGWTKEESLGKNSYTLLPIKFPQPIEEIEAELFSTGRWQGELVRTKKDGTAIVTMSRWALKGLYSERILNYTARLVEVRSPPI